MDSSLWVIINSSFVILLISGLAGYIKGYINDYKQSIRKREEIISDLLNSNRKLTELYDENIRRSEQIQKEMDKLHMSVKHITNGGKVILRDRIIQSCRTFIERGCITSIARNNIKDMYYWYHDELHGNGLGQLYFEKMMQLPLIDEGVPMVSKLELNKEL